MAIARLCYEILLQDSAKALMAAECGVINEAFENIIEANALLSGLGFQNTGCSVAHAVNAGLSELPEAGPYLHGERVGFGVLVQLAFENAAAGGAFADSALYGHGWPAHDAVRRRCYVE